MFQIDIKQELKNKLDNMNEDERAQYLNSFGFDVKKAVQQHKSKACRDKHTASSNAKINVTAAMQGKTTKISSANLPK